MKAPNLRYIAIQASYWGAYGATWAFPSIFMLDQGLTNAQIGMVLAIAGTVSAVLQPVIAGMASKSRLPLRVWPSALALFGILVAAGLLVPGDLPAVKAILFGLSLATIQTIIPLINSMGMEASHAGIEIAYGPARGFGSAAFALVSLAGGAIIEKMGVPTIPMMMMGTLALFVLATATFVVRRVGTGGPIDDNPMTGILEPPQLDPARRNRFIYLVIGLTLFHMSQNVTGIYMFQLVQYHGGDSRHLGLALGMGAGSEIIPMLAFGLLLRRFDPSTLLRIASVATLAKVTWALFAPNLGWFLPHVLLQALSVALVFPASVYYVDRLFPPQDRLRGQAWVTMAAALGVVLASAVGGAVLDAAGPKVLMGMGAVAGGLAVVATIMGTEKVGVSAETAPEAASS